MCTCVGGASESLEVDALDVKEIRRARRTRVGPVHVLDVNVSVHDEPLSVCARMLDPVPRLMRLGSALDWTRRKYRYALDSAPASLEVIILLINLSPPYCSLYFLG